jgi:hypothetical protein
MTVSVSAIEAGVDVFSALLSVVVAMVLILILILVVGRRYRLVRHPIGSFGPSRQVFVAATFAAERTPPLVYWSCATQHAQRGVAHPFNSVITTKVTKTSKDTNPFRF